jgi:hypothetical protein
MQVATDRTPLAPSRATIATDGIALAPDRITPPRDEREIASAHWSPRPAARVETADHRRRPTALGTIPRAKLASATTRVPVALTVAADETTRVKAARAGPPNTPTRVQPRPHGLRLTATFTTVRRVRTLPVIAALNIAPTPALVAPAGRIGRLDLRTACDGEEGALQYGTLGQATGRAEALPR